MTKLFYDHLIIIEEIVEVLSRHKLSQKEQEEMLDLVDQTLHQEILATIMQHLPKDGHEAFLIHFHATPHDRKILDFLKEKSSIDIEKEILKTVDKVKKNVLKKIESAKR